MKDEDKVYRTKMELRFLRSVIWQLSENAPLKITAEEYEHRIRTALNDSLITIRRIANDTE